MVPAFESSGRLHQPQAVSRPRVLIFIVAFNAERTLEDVLMRIPEELAQDYDVEILVIDDASGDGTFERGENVRRKQTVQFPLHILINPVNQGYGGNQKIGFHFAIKNGFDFVALLHGDGQYAPECLLELIQPLAKGEADAVIGSRMITPSKALRGGMPLYKFVGNRTLTTIQNGLLRTELSEFHSGYRIYSTEALTRIPFDINTNDFHFDTEIIIQLIFAGCKIEELPIPTYYGDEICYVNGLKYASNVIKTTLKARVQELSLLYDRKFDCAPDAGNEHYKPKLDYESPHTLTLDLIPPGSRVLDLGCAGGHLGAELRTRGCHVTGVDIFPLASGVELDEFYLHDLNMPSLPVSPAKFNYVLLLDVVEHLASPELFMDRLREELASTPQVKVLISTGNIAFIVTRLMLLAGSFNYGKRGILDLTHTRLFTFAALRRLLLGSGFRVIETRGVPMPFAFALGESAVARSAFKVNRALIRARRQLFSYQAYVVAQVAPSLPYLLSEAYKHSVARAGGTSLGD
jgi:glycosyltransferase involved in cell wall biosynthesis